MSHYADSSFLVSCYHLDRNSTRARQHLGTLAEPLVYTPFHALEVRNALELCIFRGESSAAQVAASWDDLTNDLRTGLLLGTPLRWDTVLTDATRLSESRSATIGTRSLDVLHVAAARSLGTDQFISFDARQRALATAVGLNVTP